MRADEGAPPVKKKGPLSRSIQRMGEDAAKVAKPAPRPERPARPPVSAPVRPNPDSATLGRDLKRAEDFKKTKPYHTAIREGYATLSPQVKRERLKTAQDPPLVSTTLGWAKTQRSREDRIILAEHDRRIKQLSDARKTGRGDQGAGHQDMVLARKYTGHYGENWGPTPDPTDAPRGDQGGGHADMAVADAFHTVQKYIAGQEAAHPGIMWNRVFAPDKPPKVEDPWKGATRQFRNDLNVARGAPDALKKEKGHSLLATTLNPFSADNALHQAGTIFGDASSAVMKGVQGFTDAHPWAYATPLIGQAALLNKIAPDKVVPNAARDLIDFPAQALPSVYQLGKAGAEAATGNPDAAVAMGKTIADQFTHPVKSFEEHPLFLPLMARGGVSLLGRTGGAAARTVGRAGKADGTGVLAGIGKAGSTKREDRLIPLGDDVNLHVRRDYSKDIITKAAQVVAEKARNKDIKLGENGKPVHWTGKLGSAAKGFVDKRELQKNVDDIRGLSEATRRLNRSAVNDSLAGAIPHKGKLVKRPRKEADLVSFVARGIVLKPETAYQDLIRHQRDLQAAAKDFKVGDSHLKAKNMENQKIVQGLLDDTKLWASPKRLATVFDAARVYSHNQKVLDDLLVQRGHLGHEQARKAPLIDYAVAQMKAHYDPNRRLTDAGQAFEEANAKHVQAVKDHKEAQKIYTTEARREAYVRGGAEVKVAHADQAAIRKDPAYRATALKHQRNITDLTAHKAKLKEMTAPAKAEPVVKAATNGAKPKGAPKAAANGAKPARPTPPTSKVHQTSAMGRYELREAPGGKLFVWDVLDGEKLASRISTGASGGFMRSMERAKDRFNEWAYHDGPHGNVHVDEILAKRAAKEAKAAPKGKAAPKAKPKGTYTAAQIARQQQLVAKMEKELGMSREAMRTARKIAEEAPTRGTQPARALSRQPKKSGRPDPHIASEAESALMEMYGDGLPSRQIAHELSRGLAEPWTEAKVNARVGQLRKKGHDIPLRNPKLAAKPKAGKSPSTLEDARANLLLAQHRRDRAEADRKAARKASNDARVPANRQTFIPGLVDHEGKPLDSAAVEKHMEEAGVADQIGFVTNRPGALGASAGYKSDSKPQYEQRNSRTGSAISRGLYEANYRALMDSQVRSHGILDSIDGRNAIINRFVVARTTDAEGRPVYHDGLGRAQDAARAYNETNPTRPQMVPYAIADPRMDNARFAAVKENLNPTTDAGLIQEFGPEFENHLMTGDPNGKYGLIPKVVADQIKAHDDAIAKTALTKALTSLTQRWRSAILHGTSFSKWTFGNSAELALRMAVAGINPYHVIVGRKVVNAALTNIEDAGQRQRVKALMLSGGHFQGSANLRIADTMRGDASGLRKAMQTLADAPGVAHVLKVWDIWVNKILLPFNRLSEHIGDYGAIGKLAQRDAFAMDDLGVSMKEAVLMQRKAIEQVAKGLLETPEQIRFARFTQRVVGKYGRLSPSARHFVQGYSPFGLWYANAFKFIYMTLPAHHGVTTALLNAAYVGSEKERKRLGQSTYGENGAKPPPEFLQGALQYGGETHQWSRYTPFGAVGAFPRNVPDQILPQLSGALDAFVGTNFTGRDLTMPDGSTPSPAARASIAAYAVLEPMIPFLPNVRKLREGGGAVKFNSTVLSPHVAPGSKTPTGDVLKRIVAPGYKTKKPLPKGKPFNPLSPGGGSSIPGVNLPKLP